MATGEREEKTSVLGGGWFGRRMAGLIGGGIAPPQLGPVPRSLTVLPAMPWPGDPDRGQAVLDGSFPLSNGFIVDLDMPWSRLSELPPGLAAELHRCDWLLDLRALGGDAARRRARALVEGWIEAAEKPDQAGWQPAVIGHRLATWIGAHDFFIASADDDFRERVFRSLARQRRTLAKTTATHLSGPDAFATIKGQIWADVALVPEKDGETGPVADGVLGALDRQIDDQLLNDGGHISRNPEALVLILRDLIDCRAALRAARQPIPPKLQGAIDKGAPALRFFRHGDGALARFHGAGEGDIALIDAVLAAADARGRPLKTLRQSGYERVLTGRTLLLMDVGPQPPAGLDRAFHASALAFELSVGRDRLVVNCGAVLRPDEKDPASRDLVPWFEAMRRTPAHSTLCIEGADCCALDRDPAKRDRIDLQLTGDRVEMDGAVLIDATHNGYRQRFGAMHRRRLYLGHQGDDLRGEDILTGPADLEVAIRFHLHPRAKVNLAGDGTAVLIVPPSGQGWRFMAQGAELALENSVYLTADGARRRTTQIVLEAVTTREGLSVKWAFKRA